MLSGNMLLLCSFVEMYVVVPIWSFILIIRRFVRSVFLQVLNIKTNTSQNFVCFFIGVTVSSLWTYESPHY